MNDSKTIMAFLESLKNRATKGYEWLGIDGIAKMETSALLTIFLMLFMPCFIAMGISFIIVTCKCLFDSYTGSVHEKHDLICACVGVILGAILGAVNAAAVFA